MMNINGTIDKGTYIAVSNEDFGDWLARVSEATGLADAELARRAGVSPQRWNQIKKTVKRPTFETVERVTKVLDVPLEEGLRAAGYVVSGGEGTGGQLGKRLHRILGVLADAEREQVERLLEQDARKYVSLLRQPK